MARVAILSLLDRGLLVSEDDKLHGKEGAERLVRRPLERAICDVFSTPRKANAIYGDPKFVEACDGLRHELEELRLLPDQTVRGNLRMLKLVCLGSLIGVAGTKIYVAISRGHFNILFLVLLTILSVWLVNRQIRSRRTELGDRAIEVVKNDFGYLRADPSRVHHGTTDYVMLIAVFGIAALAADDLAFASALFPRAMAASSASGGDWGGSSCSTSCGSVADTSTSGGGGSSCSSASSCGSSCGGGCGGGCGGCS